MIQKFSIVVYFTITILAIESCKRNSINTTDLIGNWVYLDTVVNQLSGEAEMELLSPNGKFDLGFNFINDKDVDLNFGQFLYQDSKLTYFGSKTTYKIKGNHLLIKDLTKNDWTKYVILYFKNDTLKIGKIDNHWTFVKKNYKLNPNEQYDEIVVSTSGCFGKCIIMDMSMEKNGNILFYGEDYTEIKGLNIAKISENEYLRFQERFKKADITKLSDNYSTNVTDQSESYITFVKNGKIVKSIQYYGSQSPKEFIWAYEDFVYSYQLFEFDSLQTRLNPKLLSYNYLYDNEFQYPLIKSEGFSLIYIC